MTMIPDEFVQCTRPSVHGCDREQNINVLITGFALHGRLYSMNERDLRETAGLSEGDIEALVRCTGRFTEHGADIVLSEHGTCAQNPARALQGAVCGALRIDGGVHYAEFTVLQQPSAGVKRGLGALVGVVVAAFMPRLGISATVQDSYRLEGVLLNTCTGKVLRQLGAVRRRAAAAASARTGSLSSSSAGGGGPPADWPGMHRVKWPLKPGTVVGLLLDLGFDAETQLQRGSIAVYVNRERLGYLASSKVDLLRPVKWIAGLNLGASVRVAGNLPPPKDAPELQVAQQQLQQPSQQLQVQMAGPGHRASRGGGAGAGRASRQSNKLRIPHALTKTASGAAAVADKIDSSIAASPVAQDHEEERQRLTEALALRRAELAAKQDLLHELASES